MPRTARAAVGGYCYHVINRGNERGEVFHDEADYHAFVRLLCQACARVPMRVRQSVERGLPYGSEEWVKATAARLGLEFTQRSRGRPRGPVQRESGEGDLFGEKQ
jgi:hypothetical protein